MDVRIDAATTDMTVPRWVRWGLLVFVAVPQLVTGIWAVLAPRHWFDEFPGLGPMLVAAEPPFNRHLATDAGGAFLATGVAAAIAVVWPRRQLVTLALVTYLAFAIPHTIYHAAHEAPGLSSGEDVVNVVMLLSAVIAAAVLLWGAWRAAPRQAPVEVRSVGTLVSSTPNDSR
jgi:hypothetical protein